MKRKLRISVFPFVIVVMFSLAGSVKACFPIGGIEPPCSAYWKADIVFVGKISGIRKISLEPKDSLNTLLLRFSVEQLYRGTGGKQVEVVTTTGGECSPKLRKGQQWLIYGRRSPETGRLELSSRSSMYFEMNEDLTYINDVSRGHVESSIITQVFDYPDTKLQGIRIEIEGNGAKYQGVTDGEGKLTIPITAPGRYLIRGIFPPRTFINLYPGMMMPTTKESGESTVFEYQEEIKSGRCTYIEIIVTMPRKNHGQP
jgi:hypothetical protein